MWILYESSGRISFNWGISIRWTFKRIYKTADPTGKSSYTDIYLTLDDDYEVLIACYDWSDDLKKKADHMYIGLRSKKVSDWLD